MSTERLLLSEKYKAFLRCDAPVELPAQGITLGYNGLKPYALKGQKLLAQGITLGYNGLKPVALKGQKLLAQGITLGYNGLKPYALKGQKLSLNTNF